MERSGTLDAGSLEIPSHAYQISNQPTSDIYKTRVSKLSLPIKRKLIYFMQEVSSVLPYQGALRTQTKTHEMWQVTQHWNIRYIRHTVASCRRCRLASPRPIESIHFTNIPRQEKESRAALLNLQGSDQKYEHKHIKRKPKKLRPILEEKRIIGPSVWISTTEVIRGILEKKKKDTALRRC
jgi:hypothetical protein